MKEKKDFFWLSYTDVMTSLFFVMLVLFILVFSLMKRQQNILAVRLAEFEKIESIKKAINNISGEYFEYDKDYKKYILKIPVQFGTGVSDISSIPRSTRNKLVQAGGEIKKLIESLPKDYDVNYLIVVEGQSSKDGWVGNDNLSFKRALSLKNFWLKNEIDFSKVKQCEIIIGGSGEFGVPRIVPDIPPANQRFMITIIPKVGVIKKSKK